MSGKLSLPEQSPLRSFPPVWKDRLEHLISPLAHLEAFSVGGPEKLWRLLLSLGFTRDFPISASCQRQGEEGYGESLWE